MPKLTTDTAAALLADPMAYTDEPRLHAALAHLRATAPVSWVDVPNYRPFWAITKHADIMAIERANTVFTNSPRPVLMTADSDELQAGVGISTLIHMDDPEHRVVRAIGANWFRPKAMRAMKVRVDELAKRYVDQMLAAGTECDFVEEVAVNFPLYVIMSLLGVPESDFPRMLQYTQELFGNDDAEFSHGASKEEQMAVLLDMFGYFSALTAVAARMPDRGPRVGDRKRPRRRRAAVRHRHRLLLRDHRHRRSRHHQRDDLRWAACADREPRPASTACVTTRN